MSTTIKTTGNQPISLEDPPSGLGRIMGKLGGLFVGRKVRADAPAPSPAPIEPEVVVPPLVELPLPSRRRKVSERPMASGPGRSGVRRSLESSRELQEPIVDVFEESDHLLVFAILPGVDPSLVKLKLIDDLLVISSTAPAPAHRKEVPLPAVFDQQSMTRASRDGVLEVRLDLRGGRQTRPGSWSGD